MPTQQHPFLSDPRVQNLIRCRARGMVGHFGFSMSDQEDLEQEFRLTILMKSSQFDQSKSSVQTFSDRIIRHRIADLIAERQAQCRDWCKTISLSEPFSGEETDLTIEDCLDSAGNIDAHKSNLSPEHEACDLRMDIERFLTRLEPQLRDFCMRLLRQTIAEIGQETGEAASTLYSRQQRIAALYQKFQKGQKIVP